jgi:hypothetical protein
MFQNPADYLANPVKRERPTLSYRDWVTMVDHFLPYGYYLDWSKNSVRQAYAEGVSPEEFVRTRGAKIYR